MNIFQSKSSTLVKVVTIGVVMALAFVSLSLVVIDKKYGLIGSLILGAIIIGALVYFYANSLDKIIVEKDGVVLKKNIGQIYIPKSDIVKVDKLAYSNLTMTYGSKGVFGFIGYTMDDTVSFVKDRNHMVRITTSSKKHILSSENIDELLSAIRAL